MGLPDYKNNPEFNEAYWFSLPKPIREFRTTMDMGARSALMEKLAADGFAHLLDVPIHLWQLDPYTTMLHRMYYGFQWVRSAFMPNTVEPGPGVFGSIKVSSNIADYPAFDPPPPVVKPTGVVFGPLEHVVGKLWSCDPRDTTAHGTVMEKNGRKFTKIRRTDPWLFQAWEEG